MSRDNTKKIKKWSLPLIMLLTSFGCASFGFASWVAVGGVSYGIDGIVQREEFDLAPSLVEVISIDSMDSFQYYAGYGFVSDGIFVLDYNLTGTCTIDSEIAKNCLLSFAGESKSLKIDFELSTELDGGFEVNNFTSSDVTLSSELFATVSNTPSVAETIFTTFTIVCDRNDENIEFDFNINICFEGEREDFPDLADANFEITMMPRENAS